VEETKAKGVTSVPAVRILLFLLYGIPAAGTLNNFFSILTVLLQVPAGTSIRPMGLAMWVLLVAAVTAAAGGVLCIITVIWWRKVPVLWINGVLAMPLCTAPYWVGIYFFRWFAAFRGLDLAY